MMRKSKVIILALILLVLVAAAVFVVAFVTKEDQQLSESIIKKEPDQTELPSQLYNDFAKLLTDDGEKQNDFKEISLLIDDNIISPHVSTDGGSIYYLSDDLDAIMKRSLKSDKQEVYFSDDLLQDTEELIWSPENDEAYLNTTKGFYLYKVTDNSVFELSKNIKDISYSLNGGRIAYQYINYISDENYFSVSNPDGSNYVNLIDIQPVDEEASDGIVFGWFPDNQTVYYAYESSDVSGSEFEKVNVRNKEVSKMDDWGDIGEILFAPSFGKVLYVIFDNENFIPQIWIMDEDGSNRRYTGIDNFLSKCIVQHKKPILVCALSEKVFGVDSNDVIVKYNIETSGIEPVTRLDNAKVYNINNILLSQDDQKIYFLNNIDQKLYVVE
ncbi:hypothetical protein KJ903_04935 [Patescibacteria group bacterium]|nr:hypothetical protein [Patescibacteria group bacterium]